jgi:uncharacterized repeat protein (TIGR03847 family)
VDGATLDLGSVAEARVESFGEPGRRTFRILVSAGTAQVSVWLEKEQVVALGSAIGQLLERVPSGYGHHPSASGDDALSGDLEVRVGALSVGYDSEAAGFVFEASEFESPLGIDNVRFVANRQQLSAMDDQIKEIVAGSRPRCVLCGTPLTGEPHFCPPSNGHTRVAGAD